MVVVCLILDQESGFVFEYFLCALLHDCNCLAIDKKKQLISYRFALQRILACKTNCPKIYSSLVDYCLSQELFY